MKKYSVEQLELLLLQNMDYVHMDHRKWDSEFVDYGMKCSQYNNESYELNGYQITKTPGGFVMLYFPDGTRCQGVSQEKLRSLFDRCALYYLQKSTKNIKNFLDSERTYVAKAKAPAKYVVLDSTHRGAFAECFKVSKEHDKYNLVTGFGTHFDVEIIPQDYIRGVYNDVVEIYDLQQLAQTPIIHVEEDRNENEMHKDGFVETWWSNVYNIKFAGQGEYQLLDNQDRNTHIAVLQTPKGKQILENCGMKTRLLDGIKNAAESWLFTHSR